MRKAKSPYQRHAKAPTRYSAEYYSWREAVRRNDDRAVEEADRAWKRRHALTVASLPSDKMRPRWGRKPAGRLAEAAE